MFKSSFEKTCGEDEKVIEKVSDIMVKKVITISPDKNLVDAARLMEKKKIGSLVVVKNKKLVGIITESDFVKFTASGHDGKLTKVEDVMRTKVITCNPAMPAINAIFFLKEQKIRHLPIVERNKPIGIVTMRDLITKGKLMLFL